MMNENFIHQIKKFNQLYSLPVNEKPTIPSLKRLQNLKNILLDELNEIDEIIETYKESVKEIQIKENEDSHLGWEEINQKLPFEKKTEILTELGDLLGDLIVYITSESTKYGLNMERILNYIMESNFSKLGEDGKPIHDERGYIVKGPNYFRPQTKINELLKQELQN